MHDDKIHTDKLKIREVNLFDAEYDRKQKEPIPIHEAAKKSHIDFHIYCMDVITEKFKDLSAIPTVEQLYKDWLTLKTQQK